ncbi:hypothetical protein RAZWK3B_11652 [Roseobacter sp. AzwK-3b]|uniref:type II toxin-antitoxin system RelE/ParE family toxin n=1 Tax=Roseobacter sp. AzwK-3b TaxID=351016 RepID=UPI000156A1B6|nr:type II toxin-antitoxin system RelE/ParE family toxin [Roseobacter sp. AzwK-3b]EDM69391.1 hypothetical protein RAZWK3B_11652 [Roseobacter sp. AzwK-3b]
MSKTWRLTEKAEQSLYEIALWTFETFGPRQADAYEQDILVKLDDIASSIAHSQSCSILLGSDISEDVRFGRVGAHYLIYVELADSFVLLDVLHQSVDLPRRLAHVLGKTHI